MAELPSVLSFVFILAFVVTSIVSLGLSLRLAQIATPPDEVRLVTVALAANAVTVPVAGVILTRVLPLEQPLQVGLLLLGCLAALACLPWLARLAKANVPLAVGLMTLLMAATVVNLPIVLPLLFPGVAVDAESVGVTLMLEFLLSLGLIALLPRTQGLGGRRLVLPRADRSDP